MSIYHNGQKIAGYTSGRNSAILSNVTLLPGEFKTQEDGTYMCTLDNTLVLNESIVDVYFASSSQKAGSKANIWVSSAAGKIYFHAKKVPTQGLIAETIRIVNPSQDDSYNSDQSAAITGLQQPVFEDYNGIYPTTTDTKHTAVDTSKLPNYTETPENDEPLNYIIPSLGKVKSKNPLATVLEGVKGALSWSAFLISNLKANVTKLQTDLSKLQIDLTSHISDYRNKASELSKSYDSVKSSLDSVKSSLDSVKSSYDKRLEGYISGNFGFDTYLTQGRYNVSSNAGTSKGNPYDGYCYGVLFVTVSDGYTYNGTNNWIWHIFINTSGNFWERHRINAGSWTSWVQFK